MELTDFTTDTLPDGTLHELSRFACGCIDDTYETPGRHVLPGPEQHYCAAHGGPRPKPWISWARPCGTTLPQRGEP